MQLVYNTKTKNKSLTFNPVCFDKKIHVRLKADFVRVEGFEQKLSFIITSKLALFITNHEDFEIDSHLKNKESTRQFLWDKYINEFKESQDYLDIKKILNNYFIFKDLKLLPKYKGIEESTTQFALDILKDVEGIKKLDSIVKLRDFLLDDGYSLIIRETKEKDLYKKFRNKAVRKEVRKATPYESVGLW